MLRDRVHKGQHQAWFRVQWDLRIPQAQLFSAIVENYTTDEGVQASYRLFQV
jgi:hypothetical protein